MKNLKLTNKNLRSFNRVLSIFLSILIMLASIEVGSFKAKADDNYTDNLKNVVTNASITPTSTDSNGNTMIVQGRVYDLTINFLEDKYQLLTDGEMTYGLPSQVTLEKINNPTFDISINNGEYVVSGNTFTKSADGKSLVVKFNTADPNYDKITSAGDVHFDLKADATVTLGDDDTEIDFGNGTVIKVVKDTNPAVSVVKEATTNWNSNVVNYTVKVNAKNANTNVSVADTIKGSLLTLDTSSIKATSSINGDVTSNVNISTQSNGFTSTIPSMTDNETITYTYSATVNMDGLNGDITVDQSNNEVSVKSNEDTTGQTTDKDISYKISHTSLNKYNSGSTVTDGNEITWTIEANSDGLGTLPATITDTLSGEDVLSYSGTGINIVVTGKDESNNDKEIRNETVSWSDLDVTDSSKSFVYNLPDSEKGKNYKYKITYTTKADIGSATTDKVATNTATDDRGNTSSGNVTVQPSVSNLTTYSKAVTSVDREEISWTITVNIPKDGLSQLVVTDILPTIGQENTGNVTTSGYDHAGSNGNYFKGNQVYSAHDTFDSATVTGTTGTERYVENVNANGDIVTWTFYKDAGTDNPGINGSGTDTQKQIVITVKTKNDQGWVEFADYLNEKSPTSLWGRNQHINQVKVNDADVVKATATVPLSEVVTKTFVNQTEEVINGVSYPVFNFKVRIESPANSSSTFKDTFDTSLLKYLEGSVVYKAGDYYNQYDSNVSKPTATATSEGVTFDISFNKQQNGEYFQVYDLYYSLIPKDYASLQELDKQSLASANNKVTLKNSFSGDGKTSGVDFDYTYNPLNKSLSSEPNQSNNYKASYSVSINPGAVKVGTENTITVTDTMTNLKFIPETLKITSGGKEVTGFSYTYTGTVLTFTNLPNETAMTITYDAYVMGSKDETVNYSNTASIGSVTSGNSVNRNVKLSLNASGQGGGTFPYLYISKVSSENRSQTLAGATFKLQVQNESGWQDVTYTRGTNIGEIVTITTKTDEATILRGDMDAYGWTLVNGTKYRLIETVAPEGYALDTNPIEFTIVDLVGTLEEYMAGDTMTIVNTPSNAASITLYAKKNYTDGTNSLTLNGDDFEFNLVEVDANGVAITGDDAYSDKKTNNASGLVTFSPLTYTEAGTHYYKITEAKAGTTEKGIKYSSTSSIITVTVTESNGVLTATADKNASSSTDTTVSFTNKWLDYIETEIDLYAKKQYVDADDNALTLTGNEFTFTLTQVDADGKTVTDGISKEANNDSDGLVKFSGIEFKTPGTYYFEVAETNTGAGGVTYATNKVKLTVTVTANDSNVLSASVDKKASSSTETEVSFKNSYKADDANITLYARKTFTDGTLEADKFSFTLVATDENGTALTGDKSYSETKKNDKDGLITFSAITYSATGDYYYKITEVNGGSTLGGIKYSDASYKVKVSVTDDGKGKLVAVADTTTKAAAADTTTVVFINEQLPLKSTTITLYGSKSYTDGDNKAVAMTSGQFSFKLEQIDSENKVITGGIQSTAENAADGSFSFANLEFKEEGTYRFKITETKGSDSNITYDTSEIIVSVTTNPDDTNQLIATVTRKADNKSESEIKFSNKYVAPTDATLELEAQKTYIDEDDTPLAMTAGQFSFTLVETDANQKPLEGDSAYSDTNSNDASGKIVFDKLNYSKADTTHYYLISEVNGGETKSGIEYSGEKYFVTVKVSDDGNGKLVATKTIQKLSNSTILADSEKMEFVNKYISITPVKVKLYAQKSYVDINSDPLNMTAGDFNFVLTQVTSTGGAVANPIVRNASNDATGLVAFDEIELKEAEDYYFKITETKGTQGGITYDETAYIVRVSVTANNSNVLSATYNLDADDKDKTNVKFTNKYEVSDGTITLYAKKTFTNGTLKGDDFSFLLEEVADANGTEIANAYRETVKNDASGLVSFTKLQYSVQGDHYYRITEIAGTDTDIDYSNASYIIKVTVTDNGAGKLVAVADSTYAAASSINTKVSFVNTKSTTPEKPTTPSNPPKKTTTSSETVAPKTGDSFGMTFIILVILALLSLVGMIVLVVISRKKRV